MEKLQRKHRQECRDLQGRIVQERKSATKKTRKGVNDECAELEKQLKEKQDREVSELTGNISINGQSSEQPSPLDEEGNAFGVNRKNGHKATEQPAEANGTGAEVSAKKPNRQKARLARRAAELELTAAQAAREAIDQPDLREEERQAMMKHLKVLGLYEKDILPDGHCLYSAVADQLTQLEVDPQRGMDDNVESGYKMIRWRAAKFMSDHPDDFTPFLEEPLEDYIFKVRDTGEWGGQIELSALSRAYNIQINVLQGDGRIEKIEAGEGKDRARPAWLAYYKHYCGLGEHYNSLRLLPKK